MDLVKFLLPKHVILVHGEKPKMASLKEKIQSELGIQCYDPANNDTVHIPSTHHVKADASDVFIKTCLNPKFKFSKRSLEETADMGLGDSGTTSRLQVIDERVTEGIVVTEKTSKAMVLHQTELLFLLGEKKHEVQFAYCFPLHIGNFEKTGRANFTSANDELSISNQSYWLRLLYVQLLSEFSGGNILFFGERLQAESFQVSVCCKDDCPHRMNDDSQNKSETVYFCCSWLVTDEKLAWKTISIIKSLDLSRAFQNSTANL